jgi:hypothetical protein
MMVSPATWTMSPGGKSERISSSISSRRISGRTNSFQVFRSSSNSVQTLWHPLGYLGFVWNNGGVYPPCFLGAGKFGRGTG